MFSFGEQTLEPTLLRVNCVRFGLVVLEKKSTCKSLYIQADERSFIRKVLSEKAHFNLLYLLPISIFVVDRDGEF